MFTKILVASDGSKHAVKATEKAVYIASANPNAVVEVVYVVDAQTSKADVLHSKDKEVTRKERILSTEQVLKDNNLNYKVTTLHGEPGPTIVDYANSNEFDVVVIGSRGLNTLQEMVLGSVSHKVAKRVNCPVLIVK
ncbi:universal stress protein [Bacillus luteolus]|uniref:Universal stress protein n=1 Tax=Litchfieldia luteola TaxID=682179 RepID=A0ABR9QKS1_9BACI|nr:universal stress protein [Cytobacillus luteolus]MBE4909095.1 universal stress protein [Cytobacillus luteolus]MBP1940454.1 nucleotide-binding universal stress UspA family protein [Cytobacillus luteolus]